MKVRRDCDVQSSIKVVAQVPVGAIAVERVVRVAETVEAVLGRTVELTAPVELEPPVEPLQPSWTLLSCQVAEVEEKPDQTKPVIALPLAPENWVRGMVMVWL